MDFLNGNKTYLTAAVAVVYAISAALYGAIDANTAVQIVLAAIGASTLRHGITTEGARKLW